MLDPPAPGEAAVWGQGALQIDARVRHLHVVTHRLPVLSHQAEGCGWDLGQSKPVGLRQWPGAQKLPGSGKLLVSYSTGSYLPPAKQSALRVLSAFHSGGLGESHLVQVWVLGTLQSPLPVLP